MPHLVLLRHGQSQWNLENRFTGWVDVDLTGQGREEASRAGTLIRAAGIPLELAFTSVLKRAIRTQWIALEAMDRMYLTQFTDWRLNERHYGALTGLNKQETADRHGAEQVHIWRRSFDTPPPPLAADDPYHPAHDPRYAGLGSAVLPATESLKTTLDRVLPYWAEAIAPRLAAGTNVLVTAHGNSLRALAKHLLGIDNEAVLKLEIPTGNPLHFDLAPELTVTACRYLDQARAQPVPGF